MKCFWIDSIFYLYTFLLCSTRFYNSIVPEYYFLLVYYIIGRGSANTVEDVKNFSKWNLYLSSQYFLHVFESYCTWKVFTNWNNSVSLTGSGMSFPMLSNQWIYSRLDSLVSFVVLSIQINEWICGLTLKLYIHGIKKTLLYTKSAWLIILDFYSPYQTSEFNKLSVEIIYLDY